MKKTRLYVVALLIAMLNFIGLEVKANEDFHSEHNAYIPVCDLIKARESYYAYYYVSEYNQRRINVIRASAGNNCIVAFFGGYDNVYITFHDGYVRWSTPQEIHLIKSQNICIGYPSPWIYLVQKGCLYGNQSNSRRNNYQWFDDYEYQVRP